MVLISTLPVESHSNMVIKWWYDDESNTIWYD